MSSFIICWLLPLPYTVGILIVFLAAINVHLMNYCILYSGLVFSFRLYWHAHVAYPLSQDHSSLMMTFSPV